MNEKGGCSEYVKYLFLLHSVSIGCSVSYSAPENITNVFSHTEKDVMFFTRL